VHYRSQTCHNFVLAGVRGRSGREARAPTPANSFNSRKTLGRLKSSHIRVHARRRGSSAAIILARVHTHARAWHHGHEYLRRTYPGRERVVDARVHAIRASHTRACARASPSYIFNIC